MKTYMPLNGLRWSRNSGSANCDMPQSAVFGRPGGGMPYFPLFNVENGGFSENIYIFASSDIIFYMEQEL